MVKGFHTPPCTPLLSTLMAKLSVCKVQGGLPVEWELFSRLLRRACFFCLNLLPFLPFASPLPEHKNAKCRGVAVRIPVS